MVSSICSRSVYSFRGQQQLTAFTQPPFHKFSASLDLELLTVSTQSALSSYFSGIIQLLHPAGRSFGTSSASCPKQGAAARPLHAGPQLHRRNGLSKSSFQEDGSTQESQHLKEIPSETYIESSESEETFKGHLLQLQ